MHIYLLLSAEDPAWKLFYVFVIYEDPIWKLYSDSLVEAEMARRAQCSFLAQSCLTHQPSSKVFLDVEVIMCILFNLQLFCQVGC